jgi:hypothetical protein
MGVLYLRQKQYDKAAPLLQRALEIRTALYDSQQLDLQKTRSSLADLYRKTSRAEAAAELERHSKAH